MIARDILLGLKLPGFEYTEIRKNGEVAKLDNKKTIIICNTDNRLEPKFVVLRKTSILYSGLDIDCVLKCI